MKKHIGLTLAFAFAIFNLVKPQSPPSWGFAPPISATQNGNYLDFSVTDYLTNALVTERINLPYNHTEDEGLAAYRATNGNCYGLIYHPTNSPSAGFKSVLLGSSSGTLNIGVNSGVAYCYNQYSYQAATYDPFLQQWQTIGAGSGVTFNQVNNGIILFRSPTYELNLGIYDPTIGTWVTQGLNASDISLQVEGNVVSYLANSNSLNAMVYDFDDHSWHHIFLQYSPQYTRLGDGVIYWANLQGTLVGGAVYDFDAHDWIKFERPVVGGAITNMGSNEGTIYYHNDIGFQFFGYDFTTQQWEAGKYTKAKCNLLEYHPTPNPNCISFVTTYNIGGTVTSINCTDGYSLSRGWGYKPFLSQGYFALQSTLTNLVSESLCEHYVYYDQSLSADEGTLFKLDIFPNPTSHAQGINIASPKNMSRIRLINIIGITVAEMNPTGLNAHLELPMTLQAGTYILEVMLPKGEIVRRKIVLN